jgi:hypothetical protein
MAELTTRKGTEASDPSPTPTEETITGHKRTIIVDWDGTCVIPAWPAQPIEWMPGALRALHDMSSYANVVIFSARTSPWNPETWEPAHPDDVAEEVAYIRRMLDRENLHHIGIWTHPGKPTGDVYIDDKAERYNQRPHSWDKLRRKMRMRFEEPDSRFPPWGQEDE